MAHEPTATTVHLPRDCSWTEPRDPTWPTPEDSDRILTHTKTNRTLVCCPLSALPLIERGSPHFTTCTISTDATPSDIAATLDAIETHWDPNDCYYGVRHGHVQAYGRGADRFHATLTEPLDEGLLSSPPTNPHLQPHHVGSCCWRCGFGWGILEATRSRNPEDDSFYLTVGLLLLGPLTRPDTVEPVFETLDESLPRTQDLWPRRQFTLRGKKQRLDRIESVDETTFGAPTDYHALRYHGSNPLYGTYAEELSTPPTTLKTSVYRPLSQVSTLMYRSTMNQPGCGLGLDTLTVVDAPMPYTLFVTGTLQSRT